MDPNIIEILATAEHASWAHWQEYLHSLCTVNPDGSLTIPADRVTHWERQIRTPYADLSEREQQSDRNEVNKALTMLTDAGFEIVQRSPTTTPR